MKTFNQHIGRIIAPLFIKKFSESGVLVNVPDQKSNLITDKPTIGVLDWSFFTDVLLGYDLGFAESYLKGKWNTLNLTSLFTHLNNNNIKNSSPNIGNIAPVKLWGRLIQSIRSSNNMYWSSLNIKEHYDFSNYFFSSFLDSSMTYSSGIFKNSSDNLLDAQIWKLNTILRRSNIKESDHILDIGCGWGSLVMQAASEFGCRATGITLSNNQYKYCNDLIEGLDLQSKISVKLIDYRNLEGVFDHIFAVEMLEAVGHKGLRTFFSSCRRLLKPHGTLQLQVIVVPDIRYSSYRKNCDFIQKYVFPGGLLPSIATINVQACKQGLLINEVHSIGYQYVKTLLKWANNLDSQISNLRNKGFSERNLRRFKYYFSYCEVAFASGHIDNIQISIEKSEI